MRYVGLAALLVSIALSIYSVYTFYIGNKAKANKGEPQQKAASWGVIWQFVAVTFASLILVSAFISDDFSFGYVAANSAATMGIFYKISAFWAGHEGSLLLWLWMLCGYTTVLAYSNLRKTTRLKSQALNISNIMQLFLAFTIVAATNPFKGVEMGAAATGVGLNPLLMHWAMVLHPPTLFMGYAGMTIPFAFAIAALIERDMGNGWVKQARPWTLVAWFFLTIGIFLGALWAYVVLGWGGYWGWDPVENASILPWFTGTALLHTFTMYRRRGGMKMWAVWLAAFSLIMVVMATFITRTGLLADVSVHSFPELRWDLTALFGMIMVAIAGVTWYFTKNRAKELEAEEFFSDFFSRHFTYYLNNLALVVFTFIILGATVIPTFFGTSVKADFYNQLAGPLGLLYLALITVCPFLGWTKTDGRELGRLFVIPAVVAVIAGALLYSMNLSNIPFGSKPVGFATMIMAVFSATAIIELFIMTALKRGKNRGAGFMSGLAGLIKHNRSLAGGLLGHLGMATMFFGIAGSMLYVQDIPVTMKNEPGQTIQVDRYTLTFKGIEEKKAPGEISYNASFDMTDKNQGSKLISTIKPQFVYHEVQQSQTTRTSIFREPLRDIFVVFNGIDEQGAMSIDIKVNPLVSFVWIGSVILIFGTMVSMWPKRAAATETEEVKEGTSSQKATRRRKEALAGAE
ncbi:MAG TPA: cytochrome c-type biogenesis CcmF C-terminal domain-containing protein [Candidatus Aquicultor sp.]|jgi:cytochrome c-type biogenesis protein CcmF